MEDIRKKDLTNDEKSIAYQAIPIPVAEIIDLNPNDVINQDNIKLSHVFRSLAIFALGLAASAVVLINLAVFGEELSYGIIFKSYLSKCHYVTQICGYFCHLHAVVTYRVYTFPHKTCRAIHIISHTLSLCLLIAGVVIRVTAKNQDAPKDVYEPNLYTLHSYIAVGALTVFIYQFISTITVLFFAPEGSLLKSFILVMHRDFGIFLLAGLTVAACCGVQQLFSRSECSPPSLNYPNLTPSDLYLDMPSGCRLLNGTGICVYAATLIAMLSISKATFTTQFSQKK